MSASLGVRSCFMTFNFRARICSRCIARVSQRIAKELMARAAHPLQIDLRFRDAASKLIHVIVTRLASNFSREGLDLFR